MYCDTKKKLIKQFDGSNDVKMSKSDLEKFMQSGGHVKDLLSRQLFQQAYSQYK